MKELDFPGFFCLNQSRAAARYGAPGQAEHKCTDLVNCEQGICPDNRTDEKNSMADYRPRPENQDQREDEEDQRPESVEKGKID